MDTGVETRHARAAMPLVDSRSRRIATDRLAALWPSRPRVVLSALSVVAALGLGALIWAVAARGPSTPTSAATHPATAATNALRQATAEVTQAGTVMSVQLTNIHGLPTVATVSSAVDPYLSALQQYQTVLSTSVRNPAADAWRRTVRMRVGSLITLLGTLATTPSGQLGGWINGFYLQTAELQNAIGGLQAALPNGSIG